MGCEPRGFGWSATVEVCSARVTRLVTDLKNLEKFSTLQPVPGTGRGDGICQHFDSRSQRCLAPGAGARFASISIRGSQRCLAPGAGARFASFPIRDRKGAWHRAWGTGFASISIRDRKGAWHRARGRDLPAFRFRDRKGARDLGRIGRIRGAGGRFPRSSRRRSRTGVPACPFVVCLAGSPREAPKGCSLPRCFRIG